MDMTQANVEAIVKQVLEGMMEKQAAPATTKANGAIPKSSRSINLPVCFFAVACSAATSFARSSSILTFKSLGIS